MAEDIFKADDTFVHPGKTSGPLMYPADLLSAPGKRPMIQFECAPSKSKSLISILFPCPSNLIFADNADYGSYDLGNLGSVVGSTIQAVASGGESGGLKGALKGGINSIIESAKGLNRYDAARLVTSATGIGSDANDVINFASRTVNNPRSMTTFSSNQIRAFSFTFTMIARSAAESETVRQIHETFRQLSYAEFASNAGYSLKFPPTWQIKFLNGPGSDKMECAYIPKIHLCFLERVDTTINSNGAYWRNDGAPLTVDVVLSFKEVRVLTREDIVDLQSDNPKREYTAPETTAAINKFIDVTKDAGLNALNKLQSSELIKATTGGILPTK